MACSFWLCTSPGHWVKAKESFICTAPNVWKKTKVVWWKQATSWSRSCKYTPPVIIQHPSDVFITFGAPALMTFSDGTGFDTIEWYTRALGTTAWIKVTTGLINNGRNWLRTTPLGLADRGLQIQAHYLSEGGVVTKSRIAYVHPTPVQQAHNKFNLHDVFMDIGKNRIRVRMNRTGVITTNRNVLAQYIHLYKEGVLQPAVTFKFFSVPGIEVQFTPSVKLIAGAHYDIFLNKGFFQAAYANDDTGMYPMKASRL